MIDLFAPVSVLVSALTEELRVAALVAAASNAESWIEMHADPESGATGPWSDPDDHASEDDVHVEEIERALGRELTHEEHASVWPVYRDELTRLTAHLSQRDEVLS